MIRRVILQRVNVRMNCVNCFLETTSIWKCTSNQRSTTVICLGGNHQLIDTRIKESLSSIILPSLQHLLHLSISGVKQQESSLSSKIEWKKMLLLLWCIAEITSTFSTTITQRLRRRGCMRATIILLWSTRLSCLHLKMKIMTTVNPTLMLDWRWIKRSEDYSSLFSDMWNLVRTIR